MRTWTIADSRTRPSYSREEQNTREKKRRARPYRVEVDRVKKIDGVVRDKPQRSFIFLLESRSRSEDLCCNKLFFNKIPVGRKTTIRNIQIREGGANARATGGGGVANFKGRQMREKQLSEMIEKKVTEAKKVCEDDEKSDECKVAWDEVEEVSQAKAHLRLKLETLDPLEYYCQNNSETDECCLNED